MIDRYFHSRTPLLGQRDLKIFEKVIITWYYYYYLILLFRLNFFRLNFQIKQIVSYFTIYWVRDSKFELYESFHMSYPFNNSGGANSPRRPRGGGGKNPNFFVYAWILMGIKQKLVVMVPWVQIKNRVGQFTPAPPPREGGPKL